MVGQAGGLLLTKTAVVTGLTHGLSTALARWRKPFATHDPGKIVSDLAITLALGGDCLADVALLRAEPAVYGQVASDPTMSRLISLLAGDAPHGVEGHRRGPGRGPRPRLGVGRRACPRPRRRPWRSRWSSTWTPPWSPRTPTRSTPSRRSRRATGSTRCARSSTTAPTGTGEPLAILLRPGNAGSNTAADHITVLRKRSPSCPGWPGHRPGKRVLVRVDGAGYSHQFLDWLHRPTGAVLVGFTLPGDAGTLIETDPRPGVDPGLRRRRAAPRRRLGRRTHRPAQPDRLAGRACGSSSAKNGPTPAPS